MRSTEDVFQIFSCNTDFFFKDVGTHSRLLYGKKNAIQWVPTLFGFIVAFESSPKCNHVQAEGDAPCPFGGQRLMAAIRNRPSRLAPTDGEGLRMLTR